MFARIVALFAALFVKAHLPKTVAELKADAAKVEAAVKAVDSIAHVIPETK